MWPLFLHLSRRILPIFTVISPNQNYTVFCISSFSISDRKSTLCSGFHANLFIFIISVRHIGFGIFNFWVIHSNLHLARVSVVAYAKWRLSFNVSECKQSGPDELLSTVRLTAAGKRSTRCLFDEWKRVQGMCPLAHTRVDR